MWFAEKSGDFCHGFIVLLTGLIPESVYIKMLKKFD